MASAYSSRTWIRESGKGGRRRQSAASSGNVGSTWGSTDWAYPTAEWTDLPRAWSEHQGWLEAPQVGRMRRAGAREDKCASWKSAANQQIKASEQRHHDAESQTVDEVEVPSAHGSSQCRRSRRWVPRQEASPGDPAASDALVPTCMAPAAPLPRATASQVINLEGAEIVFFPDCLNFSKSEALFQELDAHPSWQKRPFLLRDRETGRSFEALEGRPTISFSTPPGKEYRYSGCLRVAEEFPPCVLRAKALVEAVLEPQLTAWSRATGRRPEFNFCLANKYETGRQAVGKHSDDEKDIVPRSPIASLSLGATRTFLLEAKGFPEIQKRVALLSGSVLYMGGCTQENYLHSVPKEKRVRGCRISLTFRMNF